MPGKAPSQRRKRDARSASQGAFFCWALIKGGVLIFLLMKEGDLTISLQSGSPSYAGIFFFFYSSAVVLYLCLQKADPGFLSKEDRRSLLEDGEARRLSKDSDSLHGVEMREQAASLGMAGPPKAEPELTTSVSAALSMDADDAGAEDTERHSDAEEMRAAEDFLDQLSKRIADGPSRPWPTQAPSAEAAQGATEEGASGVKRRAAPAVEGMDEISLAIEDEGGMSAVDKTTARALVGPRTCEHCNTKQQLRTKHCHDCGRCVATFDHHCFWIGTCVGEKNHCLFWWYLFCETVTISWACSLTTSTFVYTNGHNFLAKWFMENTASLVCLMACLGFLMMLGGLLFFHTYLIYTGQTTWEVTRPRQISYMQGVPKDIYPFSEGGSNNIKAVCCRPWGAPLRVWPEPGSLPYQESQRFWWIENEYWSCF